MDEKQLRLIRNELVDFYNYYLKQTYSDDTKTRARRLYNRLKKYNNLIAVFDYAISQLKEIISESGPSRATVKRIISKLSGSALEEQKVADSLNSLNTKQLDLLATRMGLLWNDRLTRDEKIMIFLTEPFQKLKSGLKRVKHSKIEKK